MMAAKREEHDTAAAGTGLPAPELIRVSGWERFPWLRAGFSTRRAGVSSVYGNAGELNLGWTEDDDPAHVAANRGAFLREVAGGDAMTLTTVAQVHGAAVRDLEQEAGPFSTPEGKARLEGDGLISRSPGRLLAILTADCVPVLVADTRTHAVGAFHAGWRGTLAHVALRGVQLMQANFGSQAEDLVAAIGPCIGACCFEVGEEVRAAFKAEVPTAADLFTETNGADQRPHLDLVEANRRALAGAGLRAEAISVVGLCTACARTPDGRRQFFSYRAEGGRTGRMLSAVGAVA